MSRGGCSRPEANLESKLPIPRGSGSFDSSFDFGCEHPPRDM
eukprot:gene26859-biopygen17445